MAGKVPLIETKEVSLKFSNHNVALDNINFKIFDGDFILLTGENGSGKTQLAKLLKGLIKPSAGKIFIKGDRLKKKSKSTLTVGLIFQNSATQIIGMTVKEDVSFGPENLGLVSDNLNDCIMSALKEVSLLDRVNDSPYQLSGGQQKRLSIAGVLAMNPKLIILDEPFNGLDYPSVQKVLLILKRLHRLGHTIVLVTHDLEKCLALGNRLVLMRKGALIYDGNIAESLPILESNGVRNPMKFHENLEEISWL